MKKTYLTLNRQQGIAALLVTVMIALIATTATIYANRGSLLLQKSANNNYQNAISIQAAEEGANVFIQQIEADLAAIAGGATTGIILKKTTVTSTATSCAPTLGGSLPYEFTATYIDSNPKEFGLTKFYTPPAGTFGLINSISGINIEPSYRIQAKISGNKINLTSEGYTESNTKAKIRKSIAFNGTLSIGSSALTVGGWYDALGAATVKYNAGIGPYAKCAVLVGESFSSASPTDYFCENPTNSDTSISCNPTVQTGIQSTLFKNTFGKDKPTLKASLPPAQVFAVCAGGTIAAPPNKIIWIDGSITNCTITGINVVVIVDGAVTGAMTMDGFLYVNDYYPTGSSTITGSMVVENGYDKGPQGAIYGTPPSANGKTDATNPWKAHTHSANVTTEIIYKPYSGDGGLVPEISSISSSWIDY